MADLSPFTVTLGATDDAVRNGLSQAMACLTSLKLNSDEASSVELVLAEALNNVVEHALATTDGRTTIEIKGSHNKEGLRLTVIDRGDPMPNGAAPAAKALNLNVPHTEMPEGGFGWFMIHTLATEVRYSRIGATNHLSLHLAVGV